AVIRQRVLLIPHPASRIPPASDFRPLTSDLRHPTADLDPRFSDRERQPGLDLLRALASVVVVIYHAGIMGFPLPGRVHRFGWLGVDLFFVLSGYLIGGQLLAPLARGQRINPGTFFARRAFRIMPAYFVVLAIYFLLPSWREYPEMSQPLWKFLLSGAKHRTSWRHGIFTRMVARG